MHFSSTNKRAFTLIELLVSIALTVIIVLFLYKTLATQTIANNVLAKNADDLSFQDKIFLLIYRDLSESNTTEIKTVYNKNYNLLHLRTKNSLHQIPFPYVTYYVNAKNRTLVRLESAYPIKFPVPSERIQYLYADVLMDKMDKFRIFLSQSRVGGKMRRELLPGEALRTPPAQKISRSFLVYFQRDKKDYIYEIFGD